MDRISPMTELEKHRFSTLTEERVMGGGNGFPAIQGCRLLQYLCQDDHARRWLMGG